MNTIPRRIAATSPAIAIVFSVYWAFFAASLLLLYLRMPRLTWTGAVFSAAVDTLSLMVLWVVAWLAATRLPLTGSNAVRNLVLTLTAAVIALLVRITALREALIPLGWFAEISLWESIQLMLPRNLVTFAVLWIGGWALIHYRHSSDLALRAATLRLHLVHARLTGLMSRLHPHFVGNALHGVSTLIYDAPQAARSMLAGLRDVIASALEKGDAHEVQLKDELHFLNRWLDVQSQRFADRLHYSVEVNAAARDAWVPRLILQPLVENVIKHAVGNTRRPVHLEISGRIIGGELHLAVQDDGPGLRGPKPGDGVGLANSRDRLAVLYGAAASLVVENRAGGGVSARIRMPLLWSPVVDSPSEAVGSPGLTGLSERQRRPSAQPATPLVALLACSIMTLLLSMEEVATRPVASWMDVAQAVLIAGTRLGSILLPAAIAFALPRFLPLVRGSAVIRALGAAALVGVATLLSLLGRAAIVGLIDGSPIEPMTVLMQAIHLGILLLNVLAAAYVAGYVAEQTNQLSQLKDAEVSVLQARQIQLASHVEMDSVFEAFDRIEAAIGVDADSANREVTLLARRLNASLRVPDLPPTRAHGSA